MCPGFQGLEPHFAFQTPEKDEYSRTRQQMSAHIDVCMGGRVAEELIFGADQVMYSHQMILGFLLNHYWGGLQSAISPL